MDFLGLSKALGPAGWMLFLVMLTLNAGLTQVIKAMYRKWQISKGVPQDATLSSFGVALVSVLVGALLGSVMLGGNAPGIPSKNYLTDRRVRQTGGTLWESSTKPGHLRLRKKLS